MAVQMNEPQINEIIRAPVFLRNHMMGVHFLAVFQVLVADGTDSSLPLE
ncbi:MAG: hypothetical protein WA970_11205 [Gammaproteobacteria bacterium]